MALTVFIFVNIRIYIDRLEAPIQPLLAPGPPDGVSRHTQRADALFGKDSRMNPLGFLLAVLIGLSLGLIGGGGSILAVPIFVYVFGFAPKEAIAMSLAVVGVASLVGAFRHGRAGNVNLRIALIFGGIAMAGTYLGARLAVFISGTAQLTLFALVMIASAASMFRAAASAERTGEPGERPPLYLPIVALAGIAVGMLTGLVGVGGGFLIVPALVLLAGIPMKEAIGTSLLVISLNSAAGFLGYLGQVPIAWGFMLTFTVVAVAGIFLGTLSTPGLAWRLQTW